MRNKILVTLVGCLVTFGVARFVVRTLERIDGGNGRIPRAFVDTYAMTHEKTADASSVEWTLGPSTSVKLEDIRLPGGTMTYGEALHPRNARSDETPKQYLDYLSEVARVRRYAAGLARAWGQESEGLNGALAGK